MEPFYTLMRILFPDFCISCNRYGTRICSICTEQLPGVSEPLPPHCCAALSYRNPATRSTILSLKTRKQPVVARHLAARMYESSLESLSELISLHNFHGPLIIPIPGSHEKLSKYGFNHAEVLAHAYRDAAHSLGAVVHTDILIKQPTQYKQAITESRKQRFENMRSAFALNNDKYITNACVILIDDVITTGATTLTARQLLLNAGARQVLCVAVAH